MTEMSGPFKKICSLLGSRFGSPYASLEVDGKKGFNNYLRVNKKAKGLIVFAIIVVLLVSVFAFLPKGNNTTPDTPQSTDVPVASPNSTSTPHPTNNPTVKPLPSDPFSQITSVISGIGTDLGQVFAPPKDPGTIESAGAMNSSVWRQVAANAWQYFQPGTGVDPNTGLPRAGGTDSPNFTDWDLGVYIQAAIDANKTGLIGTDGDWTASARLEKVMTFLETRDLNSYHYPFWFYQAIDGKDYKVNSDTASGPVDGVDTGRLFVALNNLKAFNSSLATRINNFVYNVYGNRSDYHALVASIYQQSLTSSSIYAYYITCGYASFWPTELSNATTQILNHIRSNGTIKTPEGATLPLAEILGDPLYCAVFETANNSQLMTIAQQVYTAHEMYYNVTGNYRAFSEGGSLSTHWAYEWVVLSDGRTWTVLDESYHNFSISPMIYTKIALSFLAIYNTSYAYNMSVYLERALPDPSNGYGEGVDESGSIMSGSGLNSNGLILGAANYAIKNSP
jgi:hypothetical protein